MDRTEWNTILSSTNTLHKHEIVAREVQQVLLAARTPLTETQLLRSLYPAEWVELSSDVASRVQIAYMLGQLARKGWRVVQAGRFMWQLPTLETANDAA